MGEDKTCDCHTEEKVRSGECCKQKAKILMSDAALLHAQKMASGEVEYQAQVRQSNDKGWKDEFVLLLVVPQ